MTWDNSYVKIDEIEAMEGLNFAIFYFDKPNHFYASPTLISGLKDGSIKEIQFVQLSFESPGRDIHADAKLLVDEFKKMPEGDIQFDIAQKLKEFDETRTPGNRRVIMSPKFRPNE